MATKITQPAKELIGVEVAPTGSDWGFFNKLSSLPNPDPILRRMGTATAVYASIMADAHVTGDVRSIRGSFRAHDWRVFAGDDDDPRALKARDLCEQWLKHSRPNAVAQDWMEVMWQMCSAIFTGFKVHEVVWGNVGGQWLPTMVKDRSNHRFTFNSNGELMLMTLEHIQGVAVEPYQFVISRHMGTCDNPYGEALLSRCFWPWTFKTGGFKYFMQYCEKYGMPWPFATYPQGASDKEIQSLEQAVANMLNNGYVVAPNGSTLDLKAVGSGSNLPQENMIDLCNREMSKALTSQAMVSETQSTGARAAAETAAARQSMVNNADRDIASGSMSEIFKWITVFNFGEDVAPPMLEFFTEETATLARAQSYQLAASLGARPSMSGFLEEMNMQPAKDDADAMLPSTSGASTAQAQAQVDGGSNFTAPKTGTWSFNAASDTSISAAKAEIDLVNAVVDVVDSEFSASVIEPFVEILAQFEADGKSIEAFQASLGAFFGIVDHSKIIQLTEQALTLSALQGANEVVSEANDGQ